MTKNEKARTGGGLPQNFNSMSVSSPIEKVRSKLEGVKGGGGTWTARCPAHEDKRNSLSVSETPKGNVLLTCHAGCTIETIVSELGLSMKELFPDNCKSAKKTSKQKQEKEHYIYTDKEGKPLFHAIRYEPKDFKQSGLDANGKRTWTMKDTRRVLYRLPEVIAAIAAGETIYVAEGEKDVAELVGLGLCATTNAGGAAKWLDDYSEALRGAHVVILPDNDEAGHKHAVAVEQSLKGIAAAVKIIHLPGLPEKGDVTDWIRAGGTAEKLKAFIEPATNEGVKRPLGRMLRQDISQSAKIAALSQDSLALFFLLIPHFNNHGKMGGNPYTVKGTVAPLIKWLDIPTIERCLTEISEITNVKWFQFEELWYLHSLSWREHQELREDRLGKDRLPSYSRSAPGVIPDFPSSSSSSSSSSSQRKEQK